MFKSEDGGNSWRKLPVSSLSPFIYCMQVSHDDPNIVFAGTESGVLRSLDAGESWSLINGNEPIHPAVTVFRDPRHANVLYAGTRRKGVFKTENGGDTWFAASAGLYFDENEFVDILAGTVSPVRPDIVFLTTGRWQYLGVYKSTDAGQRWSRSSDSLERQEVTSIVVHPKAPNIVFIGSKVGVYKSNDEGKNWGPINSGLTVLDVRTLALESHGGNVLYAGTMGGGVFRYNSTE